MIHSIVYISIMLILITLGQCLMAVPQKTFYTTVIYHYRYGYRCRQNSDERSSHSNIDIYKSIATEKFATSARTQARR